MTNTNYEIEFVDSALFWPSTVDFVVFPLTPLTKGQIAATYNHVASVVTPEILSSASKVLASAARIARQVAEDLTRLAGEMDLLRQALRELTIQLRTTRKEP